MLFEYGNWVRYMYCRFFFFFHFVDALTLNDVSSDEKSLIFRVTLTEIVSWSVLALSCLRTLCPLQNWEDILCFL